MAEGPRRVLVVANPTSGRGMGRIWLDAVVARLETLGWPVEPFLTAAAGDADRKVRETTDIDEVWAIGGDGTINEVLQALAGRDTSLAVLPAGTGNVVARELEIPRKVGPALAIAEAGELRRVDVGEANGRRFLFMLSSGLDAEVVRRITETRRGRTMRLWDYAPVLWGCRKAAEPRFQLELDGVPTGGVSWVGVFNVQRYAGVFRACPDADISSGTLQVLLLRDPITPRLCRVVTAMARGRLHLLPDGDSVSASHIRIAGHGGVQVDGDTFDLPPEFEICVHPGALPLRVPRDRTR